MEPANIRRTFAGMVKDTKFEGMTPYHLRHTFAMRLLEAGVDLKTAAELMRHSVEVFLKRYVKSDRARKIAAMQKLRASRETLPNSPSQDVAVVTVTPECRVPVAGLGHAAMHTGSKG